MASNENNENPDRISRESVGPAHNRLGGVTCELQAHEEGGEAGEEVRMAGGM